MYKVSPILDPNTLVETSCRMYSMPVINDVKVSCGEPSGFTSEIELLEEQHAKLDEKLRTLQANVESLAMRRGIKLQVSGDGAAATSTHVNGKISVAVHADVNRPPLSVFLLIQHLRNKGYKVFVTSHVHSSVVKTKSEKWKHLCATVDNAGLDRGCADVIISLVWKENVLGQCITIANQSFSTHPLIGEAMLIRFILSVFDGKKVHSPAVNSFIDLVDLNLFNGSQKERPKILKLIQDLLAKCGTIPGDEIGEMFLWAGVHASNVNGSLPPTLKKIISKCDQKDIYKAVLKCL